MRAVDIIQKKRDNEKLSDKEIEFLLNGYLAGDIPDYQMSAFLMAVYFNDMSQEELLKFTMLMRDSGDVIKFDEINRFLVDKHSTGGVGDKVTVVLSPILSALGMGNVKLSGKGLGHTGGTIDKFESIKGFRFSTTKDELVKIANKTGVGLMGYSDKIVPLDKKLYSLRDVTATVPSIPLIASSIMSKKLAIHSDVIILDEPLGHAVGNANEIIEAIEFLKGNYADDLKEVVYTIASLALKEKGEVKELEEAKEKIDKVINDGSALKILSEFIEESGGNKELVNNYDLLPKAKSVMEIFSEKEGYIKKIKTEEIGKAAMIIGAGRAKKEDEIDHAVGINIFKKVGEKIAKNEKIAEIYYNNGENVQESKNMILEAFVLTEEKVEKQKAVLKII